MSLCSWFRKFTSPAIPSSKNPSEVLTSIFSSFIGKHEDGNSNRAPWLDIIEKRAGMIGQPWCAIILFWEIIPAAEQILKRKSDLIPCAHVRTGARLNRHKLHRDPKPGDVGYLGRVGSNRGHQVYVKSIGIDENNRHFYITIEGNTSASDGSNTNGGEVASHKRYRGTQNGLEEIGFATPFPV